MLNMRVLGAAAFAAILAASTSSATLAQTEEPGATTQTAEQNQNEMICTVESETGSRIRRRVCRTRAQMEQDHEDAREFIMRSRERTAQNDRRTN